MSKLREGAVLAQLARECLGESFGALGLVVESVPAKRRLAANMVDETGNLFDLALKVHLPRRLGYVFVELMRSIASVDLADLRRRFRRLAEKCPHAVPLLFVPRLNERARHELTGAGINHADLSGSLSIRQGELVIELRGGKKPAPWRSSSEGVNLFSDGASLVLRVLLHARGHSMGVTELARESGVTKGWASIVGRGLVDAGHAERVDGGFQIVDAQRVLQNWTTAYSWRNNAIRSYHCPLEYSKRLAVLEHVAHQVDQKFAVTLLAGSSLRARHVEHDQLHLYVALESLERFHGYATQMLHLEAVASGGNTHILQPYYKKSAFFGMGIIEGVPVVSALQLYLDLYDFPVRGREAATLLLRSRLAAELGIPPREVARAR